MTWPLGASAPFCQEVPALAHEAARPGAQVTERVREGGPLVEWDLGHLHVIETAHSNPAGLAR
jgi:hypothetical protein